MIAAFFAPIAGEAGLGLRDDAALLNAPQGRGLILTKDLLVAGVHFFENDLPGAIARKALRVNLSDLAAKGAAPLGFLLGLALPPDWTPDWLKAFAADLAADAQDFGCPLLGGDTVKTPGPLTLSITAFGAAPAQGMVRRDAALTGDALYVSGTVGDAALGLRLRLNREEDRGWIGALGAENAAFLADRYLLPRPRLALIDALGDHARAAMDVSDGLAGDLTKMLALAGLTADVALADLPLSQAARAALEAQPALIETICCGGDDYEILCAAAPEKALALEAGAKAAGIKLTRIGQARRGAVTPIFRNAKGEVLRFERASFSHF
ncbi:thiamine-monophosphate kinase [Methylocella silvestris BL2]|uniref:Thiamine-monophosphate kinase n=1 Tax=Methylocella silvestris (strain DSM 15510 / CIP 108128 / LMG 27833 / NCIMB 13906 / BL2) TaxID=395965 RepID=B8ENB7_METSB|nr:thiamine-phosphate kinase [Methylocella silvestris]ACK49630.1 thiamine-monophosphate kinase [Methylocella silvestris BL2]